MDINNVKKPQSIIHISSIWRWTLWYSFILSILEGIKLFLFSINLIFCINYLSIEMNEIWIIDKYAQELTEVIRPRKVFENLPRVCIYLQGNIIYYIGTWDRYTSERWPLQNDPFKFPVSWGYFQQKYCG